MGPRNTPKQEDKVKEKRSYFEEMARCAKKTLDTFARVNNVCGISSLPVRVLNQQDDVSGWPRKGTMQEGR